jgi:hypothetical protein
MKTAKKIFSMGLTAIYLTLALISPFALFHQHQLPLQDLAKHTSHELHDEQCDEHVTAHIHLSKHCAACQFLTTFGEPFAVTSIDPTSIDRITFNYYSLSAQTVLLNNCYRGPPTPL